MLSDKGPQHYNTQHKQLTKEDRQRGYFLKDGQTLLYPIYSNHAEVLTKFKQVEPIRDLNVPISKGRSTNLGLNDIPIDELRRQIAEQEGEILTHTSKNETTNDLFIVV